ncbi:MAG: anthranilate phosphoribosyltransferase [Pirellulaceae bacterium]|nr:anthranilate phosphoribosyltransferase [Pirellulaceae bacterium]
MLQDVLGRVSGGDDLSVEDMADAIDEIMQGNSSDEEIGLFLTALHSKGETTDEIAGAATAMRRHMTPIRSSRANLVDTCGTGGDGSGTFNISTAAAIVAAASGVSVAKHGNRRITSKSGSADVLTALGVNVEAPVTIVEKCLDELGICFCFAPQLHPAMRHVAGVRRQLGFPTIFNLLGPLSNPASAPYQLLGVGKQAVCELLATSLRKLGTQRALVVRGQDGLDEVTIDGSTDVILVSPNSSESLQWSPEDFGVEASDKSSLLAGDPSQSAAMIQRVLQGETGPPRNITVINAAAAIWTADQHTSLEHCTKLAETAIDSGAAHALLVKLSETSNAC